MKYLLKDCGCTFEVLVNVAEDEYKQCAFFLNKDDAKKFKAMKEQEDASTQS